MARCLHCRRHFRTLDDEQDMHDCPHCGYGPRDPEVCNYCGDPLDDDEHYPYCSAECAVKAETE